MHSRPFAHVSPIGAEAKVAVVVCFSGGDAGSVGYTYRFGEGGELGVAGGGALHGEGYVSISIRLIRGGVGSFR